MYGDSARVVEEVAVLYVHVYNKEGYNPVSSSIGTSIQTAL